MPPYYIKEIISFHSCDLLCLTVRNIIHEAMNIFSFLQEDCSLFPNGSHRFSVMTHKYRHLNVRYMWNAYLLLLLKSPTCPTLLWNRSSHKPCDHNVYTSSMHQSPYGSLLHLTHFQRGNRFNLLTPCSDAVCALELWPNQSFELWLWPAVIYPPPPHPQKADFTTRTL